MRKALRALVPAAALGALAFATPAGATDGAVTEAQSQLRPSQPGQGPEAGSYGAPGGDVYVQSPAPAYYAQGPAPYAPAPTVGGYVIEAPLAGYARPTPGPIEPPSGAFFQSLAAMIGGPFAALVTPYEEILTPSAP